MASPKTVVAVEPLGFLWPTRDPFLFCAHHDDAYPEGNEALGPAASLAGRNLGMDFEGKDGWRMYHGDVVPGFPAHPHRGFETVTLARRGYIDHSDSLGATARFGRGDVQWMTAGAGIVHCEMFPLIEAKAPNPVELFQIWLNLPAADKLVDPHFTMLWSETIPRRRVTDTEGRTSEVTIIAGRFEEVTGASPPPRSWAADPAHEVAIWTIVMPPLARLVLPAPHVSASRTLYFFAGSRLSVAGEIFESHAAIAVSPQPIVIENGPDEAEVMVLGGRPIGEPVVQHGPFVMNRPDEIRQAIAEYQRTRFGGWPWPSDGPVHPRQAGRFAKHADGRVETRS